MPPATRNFKSNSPRRASLGSTLRRCWAGYAASDRRIEVARILIDAVLEPDSRYGNKASAIELAEFLGDSDLAEFLQS